MPARSTTYYRAQEASEAALVLMHWIDALHREHRFADTVAGRSFNQPRQMESLDIRIFIIPVE
ncbi:MAG: hypothetical protein ABI270_05765 [Nitrosospira sp.]